MSDANSPGLISWVKRQAAWLLPAAVALVFLGAGFAITRILSEVSLERIGAALSGTPTSAILMSLGFTALSYLTLVGYDWSALRFVGARLPIGLVALASFCGYAIGNMVGFSLVTGGGVRYRIYSAAGLTAGAIGAVALFCAASYAVGLAAVSAVALLLDPALLAGAVGLSERTGQWIGAATLAVVITVVATTWRNRPLRLGRREVRLPGGRLVLGQLVISAIDLAFAGAAFYVLLPPSANVTFLEFLPVYGIALAATLISHVPGGVGVFEAVFLVALGPRIGVEPLVAALVVFRATFYLLPMVLAAVLLAGNEVLRHGRAAAEASARLLPTAGAVLARVAGMALLAVAAAPASSNRLIYLASWLPLAAIEGAHLAGTIAGVALLALARSLRQRLRRAWGLALIALAVGALSALVRGWEVELAAALVLFWVILAASGAQFDRRDARIGQGLPWAWTLGLVGAVAGALWLMLFLHEFRRLGDQYLSVFALDADAARSSRAILVAVVAAIVVALARPLARAGGRASSLEARPTVTTINFNDPRAPDLFAAADGIVLSDSRRTGLAYRQRGRRVLAPLPPQGEAREAADVLWLWCDLAERGGLTPVLGPAPAEWRPQLVDLGFEMVPAGAEVILSTDRRVTQTIQDLVLHPIPATPGHIVLRAERAGQTLGDVRLLRLPAAEEAVLTRIEWAMPVATDTVLAVLAGLPSMLAGMGVRRLRLGLAPLPDQSDGPARALWRPLANILFPAWDSSDALRTLGSFLDGLDPVWAPRLVAVWPGVDPLEAMADLAEALE
ncbi:MAG: hypothetical protein SF002_00970 [Alphaproteobacteria bacterium]|nr:hypothetical protein [Alphaproteobacteria bacterium]